MRVAYISPFTNTTNRYIDLQKQILRDCGFDVRPLTIKAVLMGKAWGILNARNLLLFHWLETRPFQWKGAHPSVSPKGLLEFLFYVLLMGLARARVVYFVHDHAVHDTEGWRQRFSKSLIGLLRALADLRVVHDPSFCDAYKARYLPHPLYWDAWPDSPVLAKAPSTGVPRPFRFGMLGAVRPYKAIHRILQAWPKDVSLTIQGRATPAYEAEIKTIIEARQLAQVVDFRPRFLSDAEFSDALQAIDGLILGHAEKSMLVSGAFFEAIGRVPMIYARITPFMAWAAGQLPGIRTFETDQELIDKVRSFTEGDALGVQQEALAIELFGRHSCVRQYGAAFA